MTAEDVDKLPEATRSQVALCQDGEYALIYDSKGKAWSTGIQDGRRVKIRHYYAMELDEK